MIYSIQSLVAALKAARKAKKLSQRELAAKIDIPQSHLSKIEAGKVNLSLSNFVEMARTLDLEVMLIPGQNVRLIESILNAKGSPEVKPAYVADEFEGDENA